jgi:hypothetical protein
MKIVHTLALMGAAIALPAMASAATGTPQRDSSTPAGLMKVLERQVPGIERAIVATEGSNSRLQDLPTSP